MGMCYIMGYFCFVRSVLQGIYYKGNYCGQYQYKHWLSGRASYSSGEKNMLPCIGCLVHQSKLPFRDIFMFSNRTP